MSLKYGFYNYNGEPPKYYSADNYASILDGILDEGFFKSYYVNDTTNQIDPIVIPFNPKGTSSTENSMQVLIQPFRAWLHHTWNYNDSNQIYTIEEASVINSRIDAFAIKVDTKNRENSIVYIKGEPKEFKLLDAPKIVNTTTVFYYPIAYIYVPRRTYNITKDLIYSVVGKDSEIIKAGRKYITVKGSKNVSIPTNNKSISNRLPIQDILDRFEAFKSDVEPDFKEWFDGIKDIFKDYTQDDIKKYENFEKRITSLESMQGNVIIKITFSTSMVGSTVTFHNTNTEYTKTTDKTFTITSTEQYCYLEHIGNYTITENKTGKQVQLAVPYYGEYEVAFTSPLYIFKDSVCQIQPTINNAYNSSGASGIIYSIGKCIAISQNKIQVIKALSSYDIHGSISIDVGQLYEEIIFSIPNTKYNRIVANGKYAISKTINFNNDNKTNYFGIVFSTGKRGNATSDDADGEYPCLLAKRPLKKINGTYSYVKNFSIDKKITDGITNTLYITFMAGRYSNKDNSYSIFNAGSNIQFETLALYE